MYCPTLRDAEENINTDAGAPPQPMWSRKSNARRQCGKHRLQSPQPTDAMRRQPAHRKITDDARKVAGLLPSCTSRGAGQRKLLPKAQSRQASGHPQRRVRASLVGSAASHPLRHDNSNSRSQEPYTGALSRSPSCVT